MNKSAYAGAPESGADAGSSPWLSLVDKAAQAVLKVAAAHFAARRARETVRELQRLDKRTLRDIGLTPGDVARISGAASVNSKPEREWRRFL
jgi:uncharacterized protein YjiS (DUF1127 family)